MSAVLLYTNSVCRSFPAKSGEAYWVPRNQSGNYKSGESYRVARPTKVEIILGCVLAQPIFLEVYHEAAASKPVYD